MPGVLDGEDLVDSLTLYPITCVPRVFAVFKNMKNEHDVKDIIEVSPRRRRLHAVSVVGTLRGAMVSGSDGLQTVLRQAGTRRLSAAAPWAVENGLFWRITAWLESVGHGHLARHFLWCMTAHFHGKLS